MDPKPTSNLSHDHSTTTHEEKIMTPPPKKSSHSSNATTTLSASNTKLSQIRDQFTTVRQMVIDVDVLADQHRKQAMEDDAQLDAKIKELQDLKQQQQERKDRHEMEIQEYLLGLYVEFTESVVNKHPYLKELRRYEAAYDEAIENGHNGNAVCRQHSSVHHASYGGIVNLISSMCLMFYAYNHHSCVMDEWIGEENH